MKEGIAPWLICIRNAIRQWMTVLLKEWMTLTPLVFVGVDERGTLWSLARLERGFWGLLLEHV